MGADFYKQFGPPLVRCSEECAEVIKEVCKIQRFGWFAKDETTGILHNNRHALKVELQQLKYVIAELEVVIDSVQGPTES